jgi:hypothetical protein
MNNSLPYYSIVLMNDLNQKKQTNPQYSLRSYARELNINPAVLSLAMKGKRILPNRDMAAALEKLKLNQEEENLFKLSLKR